MLKIEIIPGHSDREHGVGIRWNNCPDLGTVSDDEFNKHLLIGDTLKGPLLHLISSLGPLPAGGYKIIYNLDIKDLPDSVWSSVNKSSWVERGLLGPAPDLSPEDTKELEFIEEVRQIRDEGSFKWIKVKKWEEPPGDFETKYKALLQHHQKETQFLIAKCQQLAERI